MIRISFVSAALAVALVTPAVASELKVPVAGKAPAQVEADIAAAARKVCRAETSGVLKAITYRNCFREAYSGAVAQLANPAVAAIAETKLAQR